MLQRLMTIFLLAFALPASARDLVLNADAEQYALEELVEFSEDVSGKLTYADIAARPATEWKHGSKKSLNFGFTASAWWFRLRVVDSSAKNRNWLVKVAYPHLDMIEVYHHDKSAGKLDAKIGGDFFPFSARYVKHRHFLFPVAIDAAGTDVYIRVQSESAFNVPLTLISAEEHTRQTIGEQFVFGIYYGILIVMILYNLFLYISARDRGYLHYVAFLLSVGAMNLSLNGYLPQYFSGSLVWLTNSAPPFFTELSIMTGIVFSYYFLNIKMAHAWLRYSFIAVFSVASAMLVMHPLIPYKAAIIGSNLAALFGLPLMIAAGVYSLVRGYHPARYYLLSWTLLLTGGALFTMRNFGWIPDGFVARYSMQIGSAAEMILLSLALGDRLRQLKEEREAALTQFLEEQKRALARQKQMADAFARFVPQQFLTYLGKERIEDVTLGDAVEKQMAVLFSNIRSFTALSETMSPGENFAFLNSYLKRVGPIVRKNGGFIDKYIGDAVMALFPEKNEDALLTAIDMQRELREFNHYRLKRNYAPLSIGIGLHSGLLYLGTIGEAERMDGTVISDTVNVASRIEHLTKVAGAAVLISEPMFGSIPQNNRFRSRPLGKLPIRGKQQPLAILEIVDGQSDYLLELHDLTIEDFTAGVSAYYAGDYAAAKSLFARVLAKNPADRVSALYRERAESRVK